MTCVPLSVTATLVTETFTATGAQLARSSFVRNTTMTTLLAVPGSLSLFALGRPTRRTVLSKLVLRRRPTKTARTIRPFALGTHRLPPTATGSAAQKFARSSSHRPLAQQRRQRLASGRQPPQTLDADRTDVWDVPPTLAASCPFARLASIALGGIVAARLDAAALVTNGTAKTLRGALGI